MARITDIIGKPVVTADTGTRLGRVDEVVFDPQRLAIDALFVGTDWRSVFGDGCVLAFAYVRAIGADAIVAAPPDKLPRVAEWRTDAPEVEPAGLWLMGKAVLSAGGEHVGIVGDVHVDDVGQITAIEVTRQKGTPGAQTISLTPDVTIGHDAVVVPASVAPQWATAGEGGV